MPNKGSELVLQLLKGKGRTTRMLEKALELSKASPVAVVFAHNSSAREASEFLKKKGCATVDFTDRREQKEVLRIIGGYAIAIISVENYSHNSYIMDALEGKKTRVVITDDNGLSVWCEVLCDHRVYEKMFERELDRMYEFLAPDEPPKAQWKSANLSAW